MEKRWVLSLLGFGPAFEVEEDEAESIDGVGKSATRDHASVLVDLWRRKEKCFVLQLVTSDLLKAPTCSVTEVPAPSGRCVAAQISGLSRP